MYRDPNKKQPNILGTMVFTLFALGFMVFWATSALRMGAWFMALFALPMFAMLIRNFVVTLRNCKKAQDDAEGFSTLPDEVGFDRGLDADYRPYGGGPADNRFCPYCGAAVLPEFTYCNGCGRKLP